MRRKLIVYVVIAIALLVIAVALFLNLHPAFGGSPSKEQINLYSRFGNYANGKFKNQIPTDMEMSPKVMLSVVKDFIAANPDRRPDNIIPLSALDWEKINSAEDSITWFGHSTFLISLDHKKILLDPMFGISPSPVSFIGGKRYSGDLLDIIDKLPFIDFVLITHDHYDHLDYASILKLKDKAGHFFVPYGVGAHLARWGIATDKISELNWWDETVREGITIAAAPARHFSGRGLLNRNTTLWASWVIAGKSTKLFASGDGGYGPHFKEIGERYGPFDITLMEGGQYDERWSAIHMIPEQSVKAHLDVRGSTMMLAHWGAFTLAYHGWTEPIERAVREADAKGVRLTTPKIGETSFLKNDIAVSRWWK